MTTLITVLQHVRPYSAPAFILLFVWIVGRWYCQLHRRLDKVEAKLAEMDDVLQ